MRRLKIGDRWVGDGEPCYIIAEVSANHLQSFDRAVEIIQAAAEAGADAIKLQTYTPDTLTIDSDAPSFQIPGDSLWAGKTLYQLYGEAYTPWEWHAELQRITHALGLHFFSTPYDPTALAFLEELDVPAIKIASFENVDLPLLKLVAKTNRPIILSTGMASLGEIEEAVRTLREHGAQEIALLKCTSSYPAPPAELNLRSIPHLAEAFDIPVGFSDHTMGSAAAITAVALGACIVEKHVTMDRTDGGADSTFSMEPGQFAQMVQGIREAEQVLGRVQYEPTPGEQKSMVFRRSLFVIKDVRAGETLTAENVRPIRPGYGMAPRFFDEVLGKKAARDITRGTPLSWDLVGG